jgi:hypothetical protein
MALYPDALIAQTLAASTYPTQIVDADGWLQAQTGASPQQIASKVNSQSWDPSIKALIAFPTVLAQMDKNLDWTTNLGNAYYSQPQDVMGAIQNMRKRSQASGNLKATPQQTVSIQNGSDSHRTCESERSLRSDLQSVACLRCSFGYLPRLLLCSAFGCRPWG